MFMSLPRAAKVLKAPLVFFSTDNKHSKCLHCLSELLIVGFVITVMTAFLFCRYR